MLLREFFFVSNPYHVVLNRQSSGERGAWDRTVTIESEAIINDMETTAKTETTEMTTSKDRDDGDNSKVQDGDRQ